MTACGISSAAVAALSTSSILFGVSNLANANEVPTTCAAGGCPADMKIKIGGVSHGNTADSFWDPIYAAAERSAIDSNVELDFERFDSGTVQQQVDRIKKLCGGDNPDMNGVFSTISDPAVLEALKSNCLANGIPTIVINSGHDLADAVNEDGTSGTFLHFVGADDYTTGKDSGDKLVSTCPECDTFYCIDHCGNCTSWFQRCRGFGEVVGSENGQITIDDTNVDTYKFMYEMLYLIL